MISRAHRSISILLVVAVGLALVAAACSDDNKDASEKDPKSETAKGDQDSGDKTSADGSEADPADSEMTAEEFSAALVAATQAVNDANDSCDLYEASATMQISRLPKTSDEARAYVDFNVVLFNKMADTSADEATAEVLRTGAQNFKAYAESVDFDLEKLNSQSDGEPFVGANELSEASNRYGEEAFTNCAPPEGTSTPDGGSAPGG